MDKAASDSLGLALLVGDGDDLDVGAHAGLLGPSGQNIYPEEIEDRLNNMPYVCESLIIEQDGKLVALVYPDIENAQHSNISGHALETLMEENISTLNKELPAYSQISRLKIYYEEFEKTPKRSIKRYLYQSH